MDDDKFNQLVEEGLEAIPEHFRSKLSNVSIVIEDEPSPQQRKELRLKHGMTLFGLYEGIPLTQRGSGYSLVLPDKITIFKNPILAMAKTEDDVREMVADTVWHEIGHHFGIDEDDIRRREKRRRG